MRAMLCNINDKLSRSSEKFAAIGFAVIDGGL